jgi:hypothetical protein
MLHSGRDESVAIGGSGNVGLEEFGLAAGGAHQFGGLSATASQNIWTRTLAPSLASAIAVASPMPPSAPVTRVTLP